MFRPAYQTHLATKAAQWGADQELEACCEWVSIQLNCTDQEHLVPYLRAARRPKLSPETIEVDGFTYRLEK